MMAWARRFLGVMSSLRSTGMEEADTRAACGYDLGSTPSRLRTKKSRIRRWP